MAADRITNFRFVSIVLSGVDMAVADVERQADHTPRDIAFEAQRTQSKRWNMNVLDRQ